MVTSAPVSIKNLIFTSQIHMGRYTDIPPNTDCLPILTMYRSDWTKTRPLDPVLYSFPIFLHFASVDILEHNVLSCDSCSIQHLPYFMLVAQTSFPCLSGWIQSYQVSPQTQLLVDLQIWPFPGGLQTLVWQLLLGRVVAFPGHLSDYCKFPKQYWPLIEFGGLLFPLQQLCFGLVDF